LIRIPEKGQALVESLIVFGILFMVVFATIEVARLLAFKNCLQSISSDIAEQISYNQLGLIRKNIIPEQSSNLNQVDPIFIKELQEQVAHKLNHFSTALISFDKRESNKNQNLLYLNKQESRVYLKFIKDKKSAGVYIQINTCLPVLFSSYFRTFAKNISPKTEIGHKIKNNPGGESNKNCLGEYTSRSIFAPLLWSSVRATAYMPWPASTQIFNNGLALPEETYGLEKKNRTAVLDMLSQTNLTKFLN